MLRKNVYWNLRSWAPWGIPLLVGASVFGLGAYISPKTFGFVDETGLAPLRWLQYALVFGIACAVLAVSGLLLPIKENTSDGMVLWFCGVVFLFVYSLVDVFYDNGKVGYGKNILILYDKASKEYSGRLKQDLT